MSKITTKMEKQAQKKLTKLNKTATKTVAYIINDPAHLEEIQFTGGTVERIPTPSNTSVLSQRYELSWEQLNNK